MRIAIFGAGGYFGGLRGFILSFSFVLQWGHLLGRENCHDKGEICLPRCPFNPLNDLGFGLPDVASARTGPSRGLAGSTGRNPVG